MLYRILETKFDDRRGNQINLLKTESIGGLDIGAIYTAATKKNFTCRLQPLGTGDYGRLYRDNRGVEFENDEFVNTFSSVPLDLEEARFPNVQSVPLSQLQSAFTDLTPFLTCNDPTLDINVGYDLNFVVISEELVAFYVVRLSVYNTGTMTINSYTLGNFGQAEGTKNISGTRSLSLVENDEVYLYVAVEFGTYEVCEYGECSVSITSDNLSTSEMMVEGIPFYEALERSLQLILDSNYPLYSEFFGRTDITYDGTNYYSATNEEALGMIFKGVNFRGMELSSSAFSFNVSFNDLYDTLDSLYGLGMGFEEIGGTTYLRIEQRTHFFDSSTESLDISDQLNDLDIESEYMPDFAFSQIEYGFENFDYETDGGRGEFCTKATRTTVMNTPQKLNIVSKFRADQTGIIRLSNVDITENGTTDIQGDNDVFIVKVQQEVETDNLWYSERDEIITIEDSSSMYGSATINLFYTPLRCMLRNYLKYTPAMQKETGSYIVHQSSGKWQNLKTTGESVTVAENRDVLVQDINQYSGAPKLKPIKHIFSVVLNRTQWSAILTNPKGYITFTSSKAGYVLSAIKKNASDEVTFEIIEKI